jgi:hypothetical protein|tara:strand:+ start:1455 stop:1802 length:348 start_codon:yes stop_codon:yes gene_type:complete
MQVLALLVFVTVAFFGLYLVDRRRSNRKVNRFMIGSHGVAGCIGLLLLFVGQFKGNGSGWGWISVGLFSLLLIFGFLVFGKWFKHRKTPSLIIAAHGVFATICIAILTYSLIMVN